MPSHHDRVALLALAAAAAIGSAALFGIAGLATARGLVASGWPSTDGLIERSSWTVQTGSNTVKIAEVRYRYTVDGVAYRGERVQFGPMLSVRSRVAALPVGSTQTVFYDPGDPASATLTGGVVWSTVAVFAALGAALLLLARFFWRKRNAAG